MTGLTLPKTLLPELRGKVDEAGLKLEIAQTRFQMALALLQSASEGGIDTATPTRALEMVDELLTKTQLEEHRRAHIDAVTTFNNAVGAGGPQKSGRA